MCYWYVSIEPFAEVYLLLLIRINSELGFSFLYVFHFFMHFLLSFPVETPQDSSLNSTCVKRKRKIHKTTQTRWTTIKRIRLRPSQKENSTEAHNIGVCLEHSSPGTSQDKKYCDQASQTKCTRKRRCTSHLTSNHSSKHIVSKKIKKSSPFRNPTLSPEA